MTLLVPWEKKYAPQTLDDMVLAPELMSIFSEYIKQGTIDNLAFIGRPGIGKTTLATILAKELGAQTKFVECSLDSGIAIVRGEINEFATRATIDGGFKIAILDEADRMSDDAYSALRHIIPANVEDTRFIITANYASKIPEAMLSRCKDFKLKFDYAAAKKRLEDILKLERTIYTDASFDMFCETVFKKTFPDIRKAISYLGTMSMSGTLIPVAVNDVDSMMNVLSSALELPNASSARAFLISNEDQFNADWLALAHVFFEITAPAANEIRTMSSQQIAVSEFIMRCTAEWISKMESGTSREIYFAGLLIDYYKTRSK